MADNQQTTDTPLTEKNATDKATTDKEIPLDPRILSATTQPTFQPLVPRLANALSATRQPTAAGPWPAIPMPVNPAVAGMPDSRQATDTPVAGKVTTDKITTDQQQNTYRCADSVGHTQAAMQSFLTQLANTVPLTEQVTVATLWPVIATRVNLVGPTDVSRRTDTPSSQLPPTGQTPAAAHARVGTPPPITVPHC